MSEFRFSDRTHPSLAFAGLLALVALVLLIFGGRVLSGLSDLRAETQEMRQVVSRVEAIEAASETPAGDAGQFYKGDTPQAAQSQLQTDMQTLADTHGLKVEVIRADDIENTGALIRIGLVLNGAIPETSLAPYLRDLGAAAPVIVVDELSIRRARGASRRDAPRQVALRMTLHAFAER